MGFSSWFFCFFWVGFFGWVFYCQLCNQDTLILSLTEAGGLLLTLETAGSGRHIIQAGSGLANGAWHTVRLIVAADRSAVCLSVDTTTTAGSDTECSPRRTGPSIVLNETSAAVGGSEATAAALTGRLDNASALVTALEASAATGQLRLGSGLVGCMREGPGVRLSGVGKVSGAAGVEWGSCLLPPSCSGGFRRGEKSFKAGGRGGILR